jgi:hypothetical protein
MDAMSAGIDRQRFSAALLATVGGEPCTDLDGERPGVWLPAVAWQALSDIVMAQNAVDVSAALKN